MRHPPAPGRCRDVDSIASSVYLALPGRSLIDCDPSRGGTAPPLAEPGAPRDAASATAAKSALHSNGLLTAGQPVSSMNLRVVGRTTLPVQNTVRLDRSGFSDTIFVHSSVPVIPGIQTFPGDQV